MNNSVQNNNLVDYCYVIVRLTGGVQRLFKKSSLFYEILPPFSVHFQISPPPFKKGGMKLWKLTILQMEAFTRFWILSKNQKRSVKKDASLYVHYYLSSNKYRYLYKYARGTYFYLNSQCIYLSHKTNELHLIINY